MTHSGLFHALSRSMRKVRLLGRFAHRPYALREMAQTCRSLACLCRSDAQKAHTSRQKPPERMRHLPMLGLTVRFGAM